MKVEVPVGAHGELGPHAVVHAMVEQGRECVLALGALLVLGATLIQRSAIQTHAQWLQPGGLGVAGVGAVSDVEVGVAREVDAVRMATPVLAE